MGTLSTKKENFITKMWTEIKNFLDIIIYTYNYNGAVQWRLRKSLTITLSEISERRNHLLKCQRDKCKKTHFFGIWLTFSKLFEIVREISKRVVFLHLQKNHLFGDLSDIFEMIWDCQRDLKKVCFLHLQKKTTFL